jgi:hypothetical protein
MDIIRYLENDICSILYGSTILLPALFFDTLRDRYNITIRTGALVGRIACLRQIQRGPLKQSQHQICKLDS